MQINVAQLLKSGTGETRDVHFNERSELLEREVAVRAPIRGEARLTRTQRGILVAATYQTEIELECGRCLESFQAPLEGEFEDEFLPQVDIWTGAQVEVEDEAMLIGEDHVLDMVEPIRQDIVGRVPLQPLCREACEGLCPQCGAARNSESCTCEPAVRESPFQALAELLRDDGAEKDRDERP